jgi:Cu+-exporting ATPase
VLIRNAVALENAGRLTTLVVDKTGTVTEGTPNVANVHVLGADSPERVLATAAALEQGALHPLAQAIVARAREVDVELPPVRELTVLPGLGAFAKMGDDDALVGSLAFLASRGIDVDHAHIATMIAPGESIVGVARAKTLIGVVALADRVRDTSRAAISALAREGVDVLMLSGDNAATVEAIAREVGIVHARGEMTPAAKVEEIQRRRRAGEVVGMLGDGINDAPALAAADVSFAIGTGSAIAIEAADVTIVRNDVRAVADAIALSRATRRKIRQNLFFAFAYNVLGIPLAALGFLNPVIAGAAMAMSSVSVVGNALTLRRFRPRR